MAYTMTTPSPVTTAYVHSGRGGAGNIRTSSKKSAGASAAAAAAATAGGAGLSSSQAPTTRRFFSGIGGAGNTHAARDRPVLSLEDEFRRATAREVAPTGHCGIGGAGNVFHKKGDHHGRSSDDEQSDRSASLTSKTKLWTRVANTLSRH